MTFRSHSHLNPIKTCGGIGLRSILGIDDWCIGSKRKPVTFVFNMKIAWKAQKNTFGIIAVIPAMMLTGCGDSSHKRLDSDYELSATSFDVAHLKMVEGKSGVVLPPGSEGCNLLWRGQQIDPSFRARVLIPNASVKGLIEQIKGFPDQKITVDAPKTPKLVWWQPSEGAVAVERTFIRAGAYVHLIVRKENESWFLFLEWVSA